MEELTKARILYFKAVRCWLTNNLEYSIEICDELSKILHKNRHLVEEREGISQLRQLVWFLKMRCLAEDYFVNECLLLNEDDVDDDEFQMRIINGNRLSRQDSMFHSSTSKVSGKETSNRRMTATSRETCDIRRPMTGIVTGRISSVSSRQSSRGTNYRPLTTSMTATQTAFSRSTRPLLRYATNNYLAKLAFEYLYNAQTVNNKCPDYRQCLEFLNLVRNSTRKEHKITSKIRERVVDTTIKSNEKSILINIGTAENEQRSLETFWLVSYGICYFHLKMNQQAEESFESALKTNPKHLDSYFWLVKIYLRSNQPLKALKTCEKGLAQSRNSLLYNWLARAQSLMGNLYLAHKTLRESLKHFPTNIEALANVGHFAFCKDQHELALKCFERIELMTANQRAALRLNEKLMNESLSRIFNNLALCNFYCGYYHNVMPLFTKALLNSPSKDVTSDIWYNISFVPIECGLNSLAIVCLKLALENNSQNDEAVNNLGVLTYGRFINDDMHFPNKTETSSTSTVSLENLNNHSDWEKMYDEAETYFNSGQLTGLNMSSFQIERSNSIIRQNEFELSESELPERLYNMAVIKRQRGQLLSCVGYCKAYLEHDTDNYQMKKMLRDIKGLIMFDT